MKTPEFFPISHLVDEKGHTPNIEGSDLEVLGNFNPRLPQIPRLERPLVPCRLKLPKGCYRISINSSPAFAIDPKFVGTMRVQPKKDINGNSNYEISGDLYRNPPRDLVLATAAPIASPRIQIPIFGRKRYHSYLKVIKITKPTHVFFGQKCHITLVVEEYKYTPAATDAGHGNFSETPSRVFSVKLLKATPPAGHSGPFYVGQMNEDGSPIPFSLSMEWVSKFYRRATLELESVTGAILVNSAGSNNFNTIYAKAGWDLNVITGNLNLPLPPGVGSGSPWTDAALHAFMVANRNPSTNLDADWRYYYVSVPHSSEHGGIFGIMFDQIGDQREGSCNFINNMVGDFGDNASKLRSAAHEIGHGFNQLHPQNEQPLQPSDNFIMTQSGDTRSAIIESGGTYPDDIRFEFSPHHVHHLIHAPDVVVRPGGEDFGFGHSTVLAGSINPEDAENAEALGLKLELNTVRNHIKLGEPLQLEITLKNKGNRALDIPETISWNGMNTDIAIATPGGNSRSISSFSHICDSKGNQVLDAGKEIAVKQRIFWDMNGFVFTQPGVHKVEVGITWKSKGSNMAVKAEKYIWVDYPVTVKENDAAALLMHPEVGKYIALGGNAKHLVTATNRINQAAKFAKDHPGYDTIAAMDAGK
jgi:hypothetical protein